MLRLVLLFAIIASTSEAAFARKVMGSGMSTCAEWVRARSADDPNVDFFRFQAWLTGFLSGVNVTSGGPDIIGPQTPMAALGAWMDNHCKANPLDTIAQAGTALAKELRSRAERK